MLKQLICGVAVSIELASAFLCLPIIGTTAIAQDLGKPADSVQFRLYPRELVLDSGLPGESDSSPFDSHTAGPVTEPFAQGTDPVALPDTTDLTPVSADVRTGIPTPDLESALHIAIDYSFKVMASDRSSSVPTAFFVMGTDENNQAVQYLVFQTSTGIRSYSVSDIVPGLDPTTNTNYQIWRTIDPSTQESVPVMWNPTTDPEGNIVDPDSFVLSVVDPQAGLVFLASLTNPHQQEIILQQLRIAELDHFATLEAHPISVSSQGVGDNQTLYVDVGPISFDYDTVSPYLEQIDPLPESFYTYVSGETRLVQLNPDDLSFQWDGNFYYVYATDTHELALFGAESTGWLIPSYMLSNGTLIGVEVAAQTNQGKESYSRLSNVEINYPLRIFPTLPEEYLALNQASYDRWYIEFPDLGQRLLDLRGSSETLPGMDLENGEPVVTAWYIFLADLYNQYMHGSPISWEELSEIVDRSTEAMLIPVNTGHGSQAVIDITKPPVITYGSVPRPGQNWWANQAISVMPDNYFSVENNQVVIRICNLQTTAWASNIVIVDILTRTLEDQGIPEDKHIIRAIISLFSDSSRPDHFYPFVPLAVAAANQPEGFAHILNAAE